MSVRTHGPELPRCGTSVRAGSGLPESTNFTAYYSVNNPWYSLVILDIFLFRQRLVLIQIFHDVPVYTVCVLLCMKTSRHYAAVCAFADVSCTLCKKIRFWDFWAHMYNTSCRRGDSNPHVRKDTRPWTVRVYQFHHFGISNRTPETKNLRTFEILLDKGQSL